MISKLISFIFLESPRALEAAQFDGSKDRRDVPGKRQHISDEITNTLQNASFHLLSLVIKDEFKVI